MLSSVLNYVNVMIRISLIKSFFGIKKAVFFINHPLKVTSELIRLTIYVVRLISLFNFLDFLPVTFHFLCFGIRYILYLFCWCWMLDFLLIKLCETGYFIATLGEFFAPILGVAFSAFCTKLLVSYCCEWRRPPLSYPMPWEVKIFIPQTGLWSKKIWGCLKGPLELFL